MQVWVMLGPSERSFFKTLEEDRAFLSESIWKGVFRFGWSTDLSYDLTKEETENKTAEWEEWRNKARFLERIEPGDWVVSVNVPTYGQCMAGQVVKGYAFDYESDYGDFRHTIQVDPSSVIQFDRNDKIISPVISNALKPRQSHRRIFETDLFLESLGNLRTSGNPNTTVEAKPVPASVTTNVPAQSTTPTPPVATPAAAVATPAPAVKTSTFIPHLKNAVQPELREIVKKIQQNHPGSKLEDLIGDVFKNVPGVKGVDKHGLTKGWGTDHGADLIIEYTSGLPLASLSEDKLLVVQVKSYTGQHVDKSAVEQLRTAIQHFEAASGLLVTTAECSVDVRNAIDQLSEELGKPIGILDGSDVARFVLKYGNEFIL